MNGTPLPWAASPRAGQGRREPRRWRARAPAGGRLLVVVVAALLAAPSAFAAGAIDAVAQDAAQGLGQTPAAVVIVAAPLATDQPAPRGDDLALRIAALVAGRLGAGARAHAQVAQLGPARAIAGRASALVFVQSQLARGDLRTTLDVYPPSANAWDRIRNPLPSPTSHAFATTKIDAEVRAFLAPLSLEQASVHKFRHDEGDVLAVACGDVDGDGDDELVLVSRARVAIGRLRGGVFLAERTAAWSALSPRAAVPVREPLAGAVVTPGAVHLGTTDRGGLTLTPDLAGHTPLAGIPAWSSEGLVCLRADASAGAFDGAPVDCTPSRDDKPRMAVPAPRFDALASATVLDTQGNPHGVVLVREPSGKIRVRTSLPPKGGTAGGDTVSAPDGAFGAQLAIADLDQDGAPDLAVSTESPEDAVNIFTWSEPTSPAASGELRGRLHLAAPAGVRALAVCPPEEGGEPVLVAVVGPELWLVRAGLQGATTSAGESTAPRSPGL